MCRKNDPFIAFPGKFRHHVMTFPLIFPLPDHNAHALGLTLYQFYGIAHMNVDSEDFFPAGYIRPELLLVYVPILEIHIAVVGDKGRGPVFQQIMIAEITHARIQQDDLSPNAGKGSCIRVGQIYKGGFDLPASAVEKAFTGDLPVSRKQMRFLHLRHLDGKRFYMPLSAQLPAPGQQIFSAAQFLRGTAGTDVISLPEDLANGPLLHSSLLYVSLE